MKKGYLTFVLHCHLPYVIGHGTWPHGMDWLNEAAAETYVPLLGMLQRLEAEGVHAGLTIGITPVLSEMLADDRFKESFEAYLLQKIEAAKDNEREFKRNGQNHMAMLAMHWQQYFQEVQQTFVSRFDRDLLARFRAHQDAGNIEIITCAATHGYLPLLSNDEAVRAQIETGVATYEKHFGRSPRGIWLPECAYRPRYEWKPPVYGENYQPRLRGGVEEFLYDAGISWFLVDTHLLKGGAPIGTYVDRFGVLHRIPEVVDSDKEFERHAERSPYRPWLASSTEGEKSVAFMVRDPETTVQVWSGEHGYPGNGAYLDFHKKHFPGGHRYWRVTSPKSDLGDKEPYEPSWIEDTIESQATHFTDLVVSILDDQRKTDDDIAVVCSPYDGELFGHWWFEGVQWIESVIRKMDAHPVYGQETVSSMMKTLPPEQVIGLPEGSWGDGGHHGVWLNEFTEWTWKHVYTAEQDMVRLVRRAGEAEGQLKTVLEQLGRELLLLQSSDWQFLITTWSARDYAEARVVKHAENFQRIRKMADHLLEGEELSRGDNNFLEACRTTNSIFEIDLQRWSRPVALKPAAKE